jgi:hypothetical protein
MLAVEAVHEFTKQPPETYTKSIDFTGKLPTGAILTSATVQAVDAAGTEVSGTVLSGTSATISGNQGLIKVLGGVHGQDYRIRFLFNASNGDIYKEDMLMHVVNKL